MKPEELGSFLSVSGQLAGKLEEGVDLSKLVYYQIGGKAELLFTPKKIEDLEMVFSKWKEHPVPVYILGWGSNVLIPDEGLSGLVLRMKFLETEIEQIDDETLRLGASLGCSSLLKAAQERGYGGLSRLTGIPGSVGGMVAMNAGTHLGEIGEVVDEVSVFSFKTGAVTQRKLSYGQDFSYRKNHFLKEQELILSAKLKVFPEDPARVQSEIKELYQRRKETQPVEYPSCGSVFKNPKNSALKAWQVMDQVGLRGYGIGAAQFSEKHSNFIINRGGAKASEVRALIELAKKRAREELGIELEEEVRVIHEHR